MSSEAISTVVKMLESLPKHAQNQALDHLLEYLADVQDELQWDHLETISKRQNCPIIAVS
jgi:hypothetical protein